MKKFMDLLADFYRHCEEEDIPLTQDDKAVIEEYAEWLDDHIDYIAHHIRRILSTPL